MSNLLAVKNTGNLYEIYLYRPCYQGANLSQYQVDDTMSKGLSKSDHGGVPSVALFEKFVNILNTYLQNDFHIWSVKFCFDGLQNQMTQERAKLVELGCSSRNVLTAE